MEFLSSRIQFDYINYKGIHGTRRVAVINIFYGENEYHKGQQWLLKGFDLDKQVERVFAMKDMSNVESLKEPVLLRNGETKELIFEELLLEVKDYNNKNQVTIYSNAEAEKYLKKRKAKIECLEKEMPNKNSKMPYYKVTIGFLTVYGFHLKFIANAFEDLAHNAPANYKDLAWYKEQSRWLN